MAASDVPRMSCQFACLCHVRVTDLVSRGKQYLGPKGCALLRSADGSRFSLLLYAPVTKKHDFLFSIESRFWFSSSAGDPSRFELSLEDSKIATFEFQQQSFQLTFTSTEEFWKFCRNLALARASITLQQQPQHLPVLSAQTLYAGLTEDSLAAAPGSSVKLRWELFSTEGLSGGQPKAPTVGQLVASSTSRRFTIPPGHSAPVTGASLQSLSPVLVRGLHKRGRRVLLLGGLTAEQAVAWGSQVPAHHPLLLEVVCGNVKPGEPVADPSFDNSSTKSNSSDVDPPFPPPPPHPQPQPNDEDLSSLDDAPAIEFGQQPPSAVKQQQQKMTAHDENGLVMANEQEEKRNVSTTGTGVAAASAADGAVSASVVAAAYERGRQDVVELARQRIAEIKTAAQSRFEELEALVAAERLEKEAILAQSRVFCGQVQMEHQAPPSLAVGLLQACVRGLLGHLRDQVDPDALYDGGQLRDVVQQALMNAARQALRSHRLEAKLADAALAQSQPQCLSQTAPRETASENDQENQPQPQSRSAEQKLKQPQQSQSLEDGVALPSFIDHL